MNAFFARYDASNGKVAWKCAIDAGFDAHAGPLAAGMDASAGGPWVLAGSVRAIRLRGLVSHLQHA